MGFLKRGVNLKAGESKEEGGSGRLCREEFGLEERGEV